MTSQADKMTQELRSVRDTVESIWIAVILAFVLRAFMIEAFVIPTGSMAPRLLGEHWQLTCPACGYDYSYGVPHAAQLNRRFDRRRPQTPTGAICPNCGLTYPASSMPEYPRGGDRILVMKYLYRLAEPKPWDVVVFRNPQNDRENYIKRLIGLPGEKIEIIHGDIFVDRGDGRWRIRTKPYSAQQAMWQVIYDNDYIPDSETYHAFQRLRTTWPRWIVRSGNWDLDLQDGRKFAFVGPQAGQIALSGDREMFLPHYGYNRPDAEAPGIDKARDICSDLRLSATFVPKDGSSRVSLSLSSFDMRFKADVHADGELSLWYDPPDGLEGNWQQWARRRVDPLRAGGSYSVALVHADFRVALWFDGREVLASTEQQYPADRNWLEDRLASVASRPIPTPQVRIAAAGGPSELWHVKVDRDVYYTSPMVQPIGSGPLWDFARALQRDGKLSSREPGWGTAGNPIKLEKFPDRPELDQFFMLGDNSPESLDGRCWTKASPMLRLYDRRTGKRLYKLGTVPRYNLIGKAFFVYWPAGFGVPGLPGLPIVPNVGRMRLIR